MPLTLISHQVTTVSLGAATQYAAGKLTVSAQEAESVLLDPALASVRVTWVSPGDSARIVKVLDAVEPRSKGKGGPIFPGFVGPTEGAGEGTTHRLDGVAVIAAGFLPRAQEAVIEMSGEPTALCPFSYTHNLVFEFEPAQGATWEAVDMAVRLGTLRLAAWLAETAVGERGVVEVVRDVNDATDTSHKLPRVGAITNLQTQGTFKDVFVYGKSFAKSGPTLIHANEIIDGAVVSGQFGHPSLKNPTWMHQNHPVVRELRERDGKDLRFAGVVLVPEPVQAEEKARVSKEAADMVAELKWDGAVITKEGGGNADADISLKMDALADHKIQSVGLFAELAGPHGTAPSLVVPPEKATALISTGNYDEILHLPAVKVALGGTTVDLVSRPATESFDLPVAAIYCSLSCLGAGKLTCREAA